MEPKSTDIWVEIVAESGLQPLKNLVRQKKTVKTAVSIKKNLVQAQDLCF
jgi:hypothetical protein